MFIPFVKYQGAGNDFILIDDRSLFFSEDPGLIERMCDRHFGIGADGLILLRDLEGYDFQMRYFNSDGNEASFCGNGGRCIVSFAMSLEIIGMNACFMASDGIHHAEILEEKGHINQVKIGMQTPEIFEHTLKHCYLNTGTWHYVIFVEDTESIDVNKQGSLIRWEARFAPHGTNVNFVRIKEDGLSVRTYEKGVENETLSCGTGVTASAIAASLISGLTEYTVFTRGGHLNVQFEKKGDIFSNVTLAGPTARVFEGQFSL